MVFKWILKTGSVTYHVFHVKLCNATEVNEGTLLVIQEINKNDVYVLSLLSYDFNHGISIQHITF